MKKRIKKSSKANCARLKLRLITNIKAGAYLRLTGETQGEIKGSVTQ